jgi:DNA (cytosine-5)-methyltransferase 1
MNVDSAETQNIISFCTGYGGIELGLRRVLPSMRTVAYVEIEAYAVANLVSKIEAGKLDAAPIWTNLKTFPAKPFRGKVHGITGGYPCQPFSHAGKRQGDKDPRHLWPYIQEHIEAINPVWCFFENVGGHLQLGFDEVYRSLAGMGYAVEAGLFSAVECGAPHGRQRLIVLAYAGRQGLQGLRSNSRQDPKRRPEQDGHARADGGIVPWPARPRQQQYGWEEPRTTQSGVGCTVNGFDARVDQLRLCGNGVVPQTAELAFKTLWNKIHE